MLTLTQYIFTPVLNTGVAVNVIVASLPPNFKVAPLRWMGLAIVLQAVKTMVILISMGLDITNLGDIDSDKVGHLRKVLAQRTKLVGIHIVNVI